MVYASLQTGAPPTPCGAILSTCGVPLSLVMSLLVAYIFSSTIQGLTGGDEYFPSYQCTIRNAAFIGGGISDE